MSSLKIKKLKNEVSKMEAVYSKPSTSDKTKAILKKAIDKAKEDIEKLEGKSASKATPKAEPKAAPKKASAAPKATKKAKKSLSALDKLKMKVKGKKYSAYSKSSTDLKRDADRAAKPIGKRKSASGNTYYEYRANRFDVKQPPKRYPKLEKGGMMAKGGQFSGKDWYDIRSFDISTYGEQGAKEKADKYIERYVEYWKNTSTPVENKDLKIRKSQFGGIDYKGEYVVMRLLPKYADGGMMAKGGETEKPISYYKYETPKVTIYWKGKLQPLGMFKSAEEAYEVIKKLSDRYGDIKDYEIHTPDKRIKLADGGMMADEGVDLFEDYENIPENVQEILDEHMEELDGGDYRDLEKVKEKLEAIGYTYEYDLNGIAYDLRKIGQKGKSETEDDEYASGGYMAKGGALDSVIDNIVSNALKQIDKAENSAEDFEYLLNGVIRKLQGFSKKADGGYMAKGGALDSVIDNIVSNALKQIDKAENSAEDFEYLLNGVIRKLQGFSKKADGGMMENGGFNAAFKKMMDKVTNYDVIVQGQTQKQSTGWMGSNILSINVKAENEKEAEKIGKTQFLIKYPNDKIKRVSVNPDLSASIPALQGNYADGGMMANGGLINYDLYENKSMEYVEGEIAHTERSARKFRQIGDDESAEDREKHAKKLWEIYYKKRSESKMADGGMMAKGGYNYGRSWHLDRARHNNSEDWEVRRRGSFFEKGGATKEPYTYIPNRNVEELMVILNGQSVNLKGSDILDGVYAKNSALAKLKAKKAAKVKVSSTSSKLSVDEAYKKLLEKAKDMGETDLESLRKNDVKKLVNAGFEMKDLEVVYFGVRSLIPKIDISYGSGLLKFRVESLDRNVNRYVNSMKKNQFEIGLKYPDFSWNKIIDKYKISKDPVLVEGETIDFKSSKENYVYAIYKGNKVVLGTSVDRNVYKDGVKQPSDPYYKTEPITNGKFEGGYWGIVTSSKEIMYDIASMIISQKSGYVKDMELFKNGLGGVSTDDLTRNDVEFARGGYNYGRSWHLDRARHNNSEDWEVRRRGSYEEGGQIDIDSFAEGGELAKTYLVTFDSQTDEYQPTTFKATSMFELIKMIRTSVPEDVEILSIEEMTPYDNMEYGGVSGY